METHEEPHASRKAKGGHKRMNDNNVQQHNSTNESERMNLNKGKPLRVLSTSLGMVLAANLLLAAVAHGDQSTPSVSDQPKMVEWSSDVVKTYFDPSTDWNIPYPADDKKQGDASPATGSITGNPSVGGASPMIVQNGGFGWEQLLLYHMIFNSGRSYSPSGWNNSHPVTDYRTNQPYSPKSFNSETFQSQPTANSTVRPKTSASSGSFTTRSGLNSSISGSTKASSSSPGGIGSHSSGFSSSSSSSGGSFGG
jgi:hypothetical protein